ncbi:hypothetical protein GCM10025777_57360 [Membranihabitans marinus]
MNLETHEIKLVDSVFFDIDKYSNNDEMKFFYNEHKEKSYFGFHNPIKHALYIYDYHSSSLLTTIALDKEGPNAISNSINSLYVINVDSIVIAEGMTGKLKLISQNNHILSEFQTQPATNNHCRGPIVSNMAKPIIFHDNKLYFVTFIAGVEPITDQTNFHNAAVVDLKDGNVNSFLYRPEIYNTGQYGLFACYQLFCTPNLSNTGILYSFGLSKEIIEIPFDDLTTSNSYCMGSEFISDIIPYSDLKDKQINNLPKIQSYDETTSFYSNIYNLPSSNSYIRINTIGISSIDDQRKESISIFDNNFQKIGENVINDDVKYGYHIFSNQKGLHIMKKDQLEDRIEFYIYNIKPK